MEKTCSVCGKQIQSDGMGTGYGEDKSGNIVCYACCAEQDKAYLRDHGILDGYLSSNEFINWPGSFRIPVLASKKSRNNFGAVRIDFWLKWEGRNYYGRQVGNNSECAFIKVMRKEPT